MTLMPSSPFQSLIFTAGRWPDYLVLAMARLGALVRRLLVLMVLDARCHRLRRAAPARHVRSDERESLEKICTEAIYQLAELVSS